MDTARMSAIDANLGNVVAGRLHKEPLALQIDDRGRIVDVVVRDECPAGPFTVYADAFYVNGRRVLPVERYAHATGDKPHHLRRLGLDGVRRLWVRLRERLFHICKRVSVERRDPVRNTRLVFDAEQADPLGKSGHEH